MGAWTLLPRNISRVSFAILPYIYYKLAIVDYVVAVMEARGCKLRNGATTGGLLIAEYDKAISLLSSFEDILACSLSHIYTSH